MTSQLLVFHACDCLCAMPIRFVGETLRPLPRQPFSGAPPFVCGVSIVRGIPMPVVDLGMLLRDTPSRDSRRIITIRTSSAKADADRWIAILAERVVGIFDAKSLSNSEDPLPPLLDDAMGDVIASLSRLDHELLTVLRSSHLVPPAVFEELEHQVFEP